MLLTVRILYTYIMLRIMNKLVLFKIKTPRRFTYLFPAFLALSKFIDDGIDKLKEYINAEDFHSY